MKFILIILVLLLGVWLWRSQRPSNPAPPRKKAAPELGPLEMVPCTLCSVHLPAADAVPGRKGLYCCTEHRQRAEP